MNTAFIIFVIVEVIVFIGVVIKILRNFSYNSRHPDNPKNELGKIIRYYSYITFSIAFIFGLIIYFIHK